MPGSIDPWKIVGWTANSLYFLRFVHQWIVSERASRTLAPVLFWWLSLIAVIGFGLYSGHKGEWVLVIGATINGLVYVRNLMLVHNRPGFQVGPITATVLALFAVWLLFWGATTSRHDISVSAAWLVCSVVGQGFWSSRFVLQWWWAERRGETHFPRSFWWISLIGNVLLLAYVVHRRDSVLIAGFALGPIVQIRNLMISHRQTQRPVAAEEGVPA